ncbi:MAG: terminase large subunit domain-containing protein [Candidatus Hodarchaeales archaeon]
MIDIKKEFQELGLHGVQDKYKYDPIGFLENYIDWSRGKLEGQKVLKWQKEVLKVLEGLKDIKKNDPGLRVAVASGRGIGKTALMAMVMVWWMSTRRGADGVVTAGTGSQLRNKTWRELTRWLMYLKPPFNQLFDKTAEKIRYNGKWGEDWQIACETWDEANPDKISGQHGGDDNQLVLFDEGSAIASPVYEHVDTSFTETRGLWVVFSNPVKLDGYFYDIFHNERLSKSWFTLQIDSRTVEITNKGEIDRLIKIYGEESDEVKKHVRGMFPQSDNDTFIQRIDIDESMTTRQYEDDKDKPIVVGIDVGRNTDDTILSIRQGRKVSRFVVINDQRARNDFIVLAEIVATKLLEIDPDYVVVDATTIGAGFFDILKRKVDYKVINYDNSKQKAVSTMFYNKRAEMCDDLKVWMMSGQLPYDSELRDQLRVLRVSTKSTDNQSTKIKMISKKEFRSLLKDQSPDKLDALLLTFLQPFDKKSKNMMRAKRLGRLSHKITGFNPFGNI